MQEQILAQIKNLGLQLTGEEVADVIWLATQIHSKSALHGSLETATQNEISNTCSGDIEQHIKSESIPLPPQVIRSSLTIGRALRPLMRKISSQNGQMLDEETTIQKIVEEGIWTPVIKPSPARWLNLTLIIDEGISMEDWKNTTRDFQQLLERSGAFQRVRTFGFASDTTSEVKIYIRRKEQTGKKIVCSPKHIINSSGHQLILVVSDCVSLCWQNSAVVPILKFFAESEHPTAIFQVLTKPLWIKSSLGLKNIEKFSHHFSMPAMPNKELVDIKNNLAGLKMPIVTLNSDSMSNWAKLMSGIASTQIDGFLIDKNSFGNDEKTNRQKLTYVLSEEECIKWFQVTALPRERIEKGL